MTLERSKSDAAIQIGHAPKGTIIFMKDFAVSHRHVSKRY